MARIGNSPTPCFWNCIGIAIAILSIGGSINISRTKTLEIEMAQYKLKTGSAISKVQKVSDALEKSADNSAIAPQQKKEIEQQLSESNEILEQAVEQIDRETKQLIDKEVEK